MEKNPTLFAPGTGFSISGGLDTGGSFSLSAPKKDKDEEDLFGGN